MERHIQVEGTIEAPDWALDGGFPEDLETVLIDHLPEGSKKVADDISPADVRAGFYDIYVLPNGINVRVLNEMEG